MLLLPMVSVIGAILVQFVYCYGLWLHFVWILCGVALIFCVFVARKYVISVVGFLQVDLKENHAAVMKGIMEMTDDILNSISRLRGALHGMVLTAEEPVIKRTEKGVNNALGAMSRSVRYSNKIRKTKVNRCNPYQTGSTVRRFRNARSAPVSEYTTMRPRMAGKPKDVQYMAGRVPQDTHSFRPAEGSLIHRQRKIVATAKNNPGVSKQESSKLFRPHYVDVLAPINNAKMLDSTTNSQSKSSQEVSGTGAVEKLFKKVCLNCSHLMSKKGSPIRSNICQQCKPVGGKLLTRYIYITKHNGLIEHYCACDGCVKENGNKCKSTYCDLCTDPKFTLA